MCRCSPHVALKRDSLVSESQLLSLTSRLSFPIHKMVTMVALTSGCEDVMNVKCVAPDAGYHYWCTNHVLRAANIAFGPQSVTLPSIPDFLDDVHLSLSLRFSTCEMKVRVLAPIHTSLFTSCRQQTGRTKESEQMWKGRKLFIIKWEAGSSPEHILFLFPLLRPHHQLDSFEGSPARENGWGMLPG